MIEIVQGKSMLDWASEKLAAKLSAPAHAIGLTVDGKPRATFVFTSLTPHDVEVSAYVDSVSLPRRFLKFLLDYAWLDCGLSRVTATTELSSVIEALTRFGFVIEGVKRDCYGIGRDGVLLGLIKGGSILE